MRRLLSLPAIALAISLALPAMAQSPSGTPRVRVAGTVDKLDGQILTVKTADGRTQNVTLSPDATIFGLEKRSIGDIKPADYLASGGVRGSDGKIRAVEVRIFPEALRGIGEGQRPWDQRPEGVMTNATVGTVAQTPEGGVIRVTYKGGQSEFVVGADVPVIAYVAADRSLLKPGATVVTTAEKNPDGSLGSSRVTAEKDGIKPPM